MGDLRVPSVRDRDNLSHFGILRVHGRFVVGQTALAQSQTPPVHRVSKKTEVVSRDCMLLLICRERPEWAEGGFLGGEYMSIALLKNYNSTNDLA